MSSMSNQIINPFATTPKETKKPVDPIGGKIGFFDETENHFAATENVTYGEHLGSLDLNSSAQAFIEQTVELKAGSTGPRDINISTQDQKAAFAEIFSAGTNTIKDATTKTVLTIADIGATTVGVMKDTVTKDILGFGVKQEKPKTPEEIKKANEDAAQRAHEQKFWANLPVHQPDASALEALQLSDKVVSKAQFEKVMGIRLTSENLDEKGKLKAGIETAGEKALDDQAKQQKAAAQKASTLAMATKGKGGIMGKDELYKGAENPNHFTKATG